MVRKPEKGTGPKVFYLGAEESVIRPEASVRPLYYKEGQVHLRPLGAPMPDPESPGDARVDYDIPHGKPWGIDMVLYLLFKAISTGAMLVAALLWYLGLPGRGDDDGGAGAVAGLRDAHRRRADHRSRAAGALLLHPHPARTSDRGWCGAPTS